MFKQIIASDINRNTYFVYKTFNILDENQNDYMCDYLTLDGIYTYKKGSGCLFDARQFHCTSNWPKYKKFKNRELLQIHVTVPT